MICAVLLIVTDSEAWASTQAHFPFQCNDLKLFDASSVLAMDEKQSLALSNCRLKKEDLPGLGADLGRRPDGREREPHDRTVCPEIQAFACMRGACQSENKGQKGFPNYFHMLQVYVWASVMCNVKVWLNFSSNRMDPDFAKCLFWQTRESWCESSHSNFPSWNFPNLEKPGKQQKEDSLNSVDWPQAFYKKKWKFLSNLVTHGQHAAQQEQAQLANAPKAYCCKELTGRFMRLDRVAD